MNLTAAGASLGQLQLATGQLLAPLLPPPELITTSNHRRRLDADQLLASSVIQAIQAGEFRYGVGQPTGLHTISSPRIGKDHLGDATTVVDVTMMTKSPEGYFVYNNVTLKKCRDVLKLVGVDRCTLADFVEDCESDEGGIDYVAFFFCAFSPNKMPLAFVISVLWLLMLFIATGVTATDFLCPSLFMISKMLGLSQNIAGVTFLAFGNMSADLFAGSGAVITTAIVGCIFLIKEFQFDRVVLLRDVVFYMAAVALLLYIFAVPGRIRLRDSICLLGLYLVYVITVMVTRYFSKADQPLKDMHGGPKDDQEGGIEFEGVHIDDDPNASMVVMRGFLFLNDDLAFQHSNNNNNKPIFKFEKSPSTGSDSLSSDQKSDLTLSNATNKSSRRVTLFEENLFTGSAGDSPTPNMGSRPSIMSISKQQLVNLRRASRDIRRQSIDFLSAVSPIDPNIWRQRNWGGKTMELVKSPIRLFLLITTPMADIDGKHEWNKPLSTLHCITGPIFVSYAFGFGSAWLGPLTVPIWIFLVATPIAFVIIFTSTSETPPFYYNVYSSYLGFIVAITWIYTISSEVINLLRAMGIAFDLSNEIMGLTILACGNSMLDFITNLSIARKGLPKMAIGACYGGPLMSHLLGIGLPAFVFLMINPDHNTTLGSSPLLKVIFTTILIGLSVTLVVTIITKFRASKYLGVFLVILYIVMLFVEWLTEFSLLPTDQLYSWIEAMILGG